MNFLDKWNKSKFNVYESEEKTVLKLLNKLSEFIGELSSGIDNKTDNLGDHKGSWQGLNRPTLSDEGMKATVENLTDVVIPNLQGIVDLLSKNNGFLTLSSQGAKANDINFDNSQILLDSMLKCANEGKVLIIDGKFCIANPIKYEGYNSLLVVGTCPNYNSLLDTTLTFNNENTNLYFNNGATLELNKMGSTTFFGVGFSSTSKEYGTGILLRSFHNKFINCVFSQMYKAFTLDSNWTNWLGENQVLYCTFTKCEYAYDSQAGSDSEFIGNLISGTCTYGFYGLCSGYTIANNHFYARKGNLFKYFNTKIISNYFQETKGAYADEPCFILDGSFGCIVNDNKFELNDSLAKSTKKGLIGLFTKSGNGNIIFDGNTVNGKDMTTVTNLAFIKLMYDTTKQDMPLVIGVNNLRCCEGLFTENYATYNLQGSYFTEGTGVTVLGGTLAEEKSIYVNGICNFWVKLSSLPSYQNVLRLKNFQGIPCVVALKKTTSSGTTTVLQMTDNQGNILVSDYGSVTELEVSGSYVLAHSKITKYYLQ